MKVFHHPDTLLHDPSHEILAGKEIQYYESPKRIELIKSALLEQPDNFVLSDKLDESLDLKFWISKVHDNDYYEYLESAYEYWTKSGRAEGVIIADVFPRFGMSSTQPKDVSSLKALPPVAKAGLYSFDLSSPITKDTWQAILSSLRIALTAASELPTLHPFEGVFALCRPPGHHAMASLCGGYCFVNNVAVCAKYLQADPCTVAILDIDYHHGNGTQYTFYEDPSVLYVSLHGEHDYPYFTGKASEIGEGAGKGFNHNFPLPQGKVDDTVYQSVLEQAIKIITSFAPTYCIVSAGVDTHEHDPISNFGLTTEGYRNIGKMIASIRKPTLFVLEGGYHLESIGQNIRNLLSGFQEDKDSL